MKELTNVLKGFLVSVAVEHLRSLVEDAVLSVERLYVRPVKATGHFTSLDAKDARDAVFSAVKAMVPNPFLKLLEEAGVDLRALVETVTEATLERIRNNR